MKPDKETAEHMRKGQALRDFVDSEGWAMAKGMLLDQIRVLDSVSSIPADLPFEEIGKQAMFRAHAISLVMAWIDAVEGKAEQHNEQIKMLAEIRADEVVRTYSSPS